MSLDNDILCGRHCVFLIHVHLILVIKYRREVFTKAILDDIRSIFNIVRADFGVELAGFDGEDKYVYFAYELSAEGGWCRLW